MNYQLLLESKFLHEFTNYITYSTSGTRDLWTLVATPLQPP